MSMYEPENPTKVLVDGVQLEALTSLSACPLSPRFMYADGRRDISPWGYWWEANWTPPKEMQDCDVEIRHYSGAVLKGRCTWEYRGEAGRFVFVPHDGTLKQDA